MQPYQRYLDTVDLNVILEQHAGLVIYVFRIRGAQNLQLRQGSVEHQWRRGPDWGSVLERRHSGSLLISTEGT